MKQRKKNSSRKKKWQIQEAKARFSEVIHEALLHGPQVITKNGEPIAYLVAKEEFDQATLPKKSILEVLQSCPYPELEIDFSRQKDTMRDIDL